MLSERAACPPRFERVAWSAALAGKPNPKAPQAATDASMKLRLLVDIAFDSKR